MQQKNSVSGSKIVYLDTNMVSQSSENLRSTSIDGIEVKLSLAEIQIGALVGIQRQIREVQKNGTFMLEKYISYYPPCFRISF